MKDYQVILCAMDLGDANDSVAIRAVDLAGRYAARLTLLYVVEYIPVDFANELVLPQQGEIEEQLVLSARERLASLAERLAYPRLDTHVSVGSIKAEITSLAEDKGADLIVLGRHGRHGFSRLLGSTANAVLHHASCDVLAVHINT